MTTNTHPLQSTLDTASSSIEQAVLGNISTSFWLQQALAASRERDPLDALNDASALHAILAERWLSLEKAGVSEVTADVQS